MATKTALMLLSLMLLSGNAVAMVSEVSGNTSCSIVSLSDKQLLKQIDCSFEGAIGSSMVYSVQQLNFTTSNGNLVSTVNSATFRFGYNEEMYDLQETIAINDNTAEVIMIDATSFKRISATRMAQYYDQPIPDLNNVLYCFKPIKKSKAFCIPYVVIYNMS